MAKKKATRKKPEPVVYTGTVAEAVSIAFSTIEELAGEMREAFENTPESLQSSGVGERRGEAADNLEQISEPDVDPKFAELPVTFNVSTGKGHSRATRMNNELQYAYAAVEALEGAAKAKGDEGYDESLEDERQSLIESIQSMIDEAEGVEFPGMYG